MRWVPSDIPGEHAESESAQRSRPLPSAPADPAQSVSSADQHRQNKPNRILCGVMAPLQTSVWFLNQTRKHWCEVSRRSHLSWDEDLRHWERRNFASPRTRTPCGDIRRFCDQRTELLFLFLWVSDSLLQSRYRRDHLVRIAQASPDRGWNNS